MSDRLLAALGVTLALGAAALPWHVWRNPHAYAPPRLVLERLDEDAAVAAFLPQREPPLITGSVARAEPVAPRIVFATGTHALARLPGASDLTILRRGSRIGDDVVAGFAMRDGRWVVRTGSGTVLAVSR